MTEQMVAVDDATLEKHITREKRELDERQKAREATLVRRRREAESRIGLTEGKAEMLERLSPPLYDDRMTNTQVCDYLGISKSTLLALTRVHGDELKQVGYVPGHQHAQSRFSRRAVSHLAMMLRPSTSARAAAIKKMLGVYQPPRAGRARWAGHVASCGHIIPKAMEVAEAVQETDPADVWNDLCQLDRWQVQALVVALSAMLPLDQDGLTKYLSELGENVPLSEHTHKRGQGVARGLAALIPVTRGESEAELF